MAYLDNLAISFGMEGIRKKFLKEFCKDSGLKINHCKKMEFFVFNWDKPDEAAFMKVDFGKYDDIEKFLVKKHGAETGLEILAEIKEPDRLDAEETKNLKNLMPEIEAQVQRKTGDVIKIIDTAVPLLNVSAVMDFNEWNITLSIETVDGHKESMKFPKPKLTENAI